MLLTHDEFKNIPAKIVLEQFDIGSFNKEKIREFFRTGKVPTAEALVDELILRAIKEGATDLHFEPQESELRVRLGFEGYMKKLVYLPREIAENLANVLKTKGTLNQFEKKKAQEGRFSLTVGSHQFDVRINTVPVLWGERIVLRIFHKTARTFRIEEIGFSKENLEKVRALMRRSSGLVIISGPASSGKSTTMCATVNDIQSAEKNIISIENPIEFKLEFASQVPTSNDKSFTFADAFRAAIKQNPNVIMLSEVRDSESCSVAAEAALTGNLVVSTLLASDTFGSIYRLLNLGILPYWLASTLNGIVYQQLVRKICENCREEYKPTIEDEPLIRNLASAPEKFFRGKGCELCDGTGYRGRTAIHEVLVINDQLRDLIYQQASITKLKDASISSGSETIFQDAMRKVAAGLISLQEIGRTIG